MTESEFYALNLIALSVCVSLLFSVQNNEKKTNKMKMNVSQKSGERIRERERKVGIRVE
jgi:hypothetical protein